MIESVSISGFRSSLASYVAKLRSRRGYKVRLLDRKKVVVILTNAEGDARKRGSHAGSSLLRLASLSKKIKPKDSSPDISARIDHYLYGKS